MKTARKSRRKSYLSIRSKLMATVAMLLVASFMVVSSSYAWFTLSTAPEVTGISTAVGANGSLEIALLTSTDATPTTGVGTTGDNTAWGNLVDLSDASYGLDQIILLPSALNVDANTSSIQGLPLYAPMYGADGRVSSLTGTVIGTYDGNAFKSTTNSASARGVRAIGTSSGMTVQQIAWRTAKNNMTSKLNLVQQRAQASLASNGSGLANLAISKAMASDDATTTYDLTFVENLLPQIEQANLALLEAMQAYIDATIAIKYGSNESEYNSNKITWENNTDASGDPAVNNENETKVTAAYTTLTTSGSDVEKTAGANFIFTYQKYIAVKDAIDAASTAYAGLTDKAASDWDDVTAVFVTSKLVNINGMTVNGYAASAVKANLGAIVNDVTSGKGITVEIPEGNGVYSDFAQVSGNYQTDITIEDLEYGAIGPMDVQAKMTTKVTNIKKVSDDTAIAVEPDDPAEGSDKSISEFYGYIIDLAFRTNAAESKLQLQTEAANRIYSQGGSVETMGSGSSMSFSSTDPNFSNEDIANLMTSLRIVFADDSGKILAVGLLDTTSGANTSSGAYEAPIKLYNYTITSGNSTGGTSNTTYSTLTVGDVKTGDDANTIVSLDQNVTMRVSVYVYLDGNEVDNADVANAMSSMTGTLNLQFSSSANLVPMDYAPLQDPTANNSTTGDTTNTSTISGVPTTVEAGKTATLPEKDSNDTTIVWAVTAGNATVSDNVLTASADATGTIKLTAKDASGNDLGSGTYEITVTAAASEDSGT